MRIELSEIAVGMEVIARDNNLYKGLVGKIVEIRSGSKRETENEGELEIIVDFYTPTHPRKETPGSLDAVIMNEEMLGFYKGISEAIDIKGRIICPGCYKSLKKVTETQYDDIEWNWVEGEGYVKKNLEGGTAGKKCPHCGAEIYDEEMILEY